MNAKENFLEAIRFGRPDHVPLACEPVWYSFLLDGNFRYEDWTDHWGVRWELSIEGAVPFPKGNPLPSLDRLGEYRFPSPSVLTLTEEMREGLAAVDRGERLVMGSLICLLFERAWSIMGMDNFLAALLTHPTEMHEFLHGIATYSRGVFERYLDLGVDAVSCTEDLGSQRALMVSPRMFREFLLPEYRFIFDPVRRAGKMVHFHSCGCVEDIAGDLAGLGVTMLNPLQARANDLGKLKRETSGRMALWGGIDTALLLTGTPQEVGAEVARVMGILKPGGGWVCGPDQSLPGIPEENMNALWQTARELGRY